MQSTTRLSILASVFAVALTLTACVDTTGITPDSTIPPKGNPQAAVVVTEFADLQCPACRAAYTQLTQPIIAKYGNEIRYEYKNFPLRSLHRYAEDLAEAGECAADQGKFWEFADSAFTNQDQVSKAAITQWATDLKLNMDLFGRCTSSHIKSAAVAADYKEGLDAGVQGTPTFFVNGKKVDSTIDAISSAIDSAEAGTLQKL